MLISGLSVLILIAILWSLGWYAKRWVSTDADYLLAGRQVSLLPGIAGICGIAFAGSVTSIIPGLTIQYGFFGWVWGISLPAVVGYWIYGLLACPYIRRSGAYTLPEWLEMRFDARTRLVVSIATLLGVTGLVAMNVIAMALIMIGFLDAPLWLMVTLILGGHLMFLLLGGLWALTLTDVVQVILGFILLPALVGYCAWTFGGWDMIQAQFVSSAPLTQGTAGTFPWLRLSYPSIITVSLVVGMFIQWGGNYYWLRAAAARTEFVARWQYLIGGAVVVLIVHGALGMLGLYAGSVYRTAFLGGANPMSAYGMLMRDLPPGVALFGLVAALAATISTTSNAHLGITSTLVRDLYQRFLHPEATREQVLRISRLLTVVTGGGIWLLSFYPGGPYFLLAISCAMLGPAALIFLLGHRWSRITAAGAFWGTLIGMLVMLVYEGLQLTGVTAWSTHTVLIGTFVTLPLIVLISLATSQPVNQRDGRVGVDQEPSPLTAEHEQFLDLLHQGYGQMVELTDFLGMDAAHGNHLVNELIAAGLVRRQAPSGPDFFTLRITPQGEQRAEDRGDSEESGESAPPPSSVHALGLQVLRQIESGPQTLRTLGGALEANASALGVVVSRLERIGQVHSHGIWERRLSLSDKGRAALRAAVRG